MSETLISTMLAILFIIICGLVLRLLKLVTPEHTNGLERVAYYIFFPALMIDTILKGALDTQVTTVALALFGGVIIVSLLCFLLKPFLTHQLRHSSPTFTSMFQGAVRWQTFIALAVAKGLFGATGAAYVAVAIVAMTPILNVMTVWVMVRYGKKQAGRQISYTRQLFSNPMILSCAIGLFLKFSGFTLPEAVSSALAISGQAGLATALVLVGTGLELTTLWKLDLGIIITTVLKLIVMPVISISIALLLGVHGIALSVVALCSAVPSASAGYIFARQMGGDAAYIARILTFQNIVAMITLPLILTYVAGHF